jgi:hypothetical protein
MEREQSGRRTPGDKTTPADEVLHALADRLARLSPSHRDPEAFHVEKHTLAAELRQMADAMRRTARQSRGTAP